MAPPIVKKIVLRGVLGLLGALLVAYVADAIQIHIRLATGGPTKVYDSVHVVYIANLKGNKDQGGRFDVYADDSQIETCARSLFPQLGYSPCWYLRENSTKTID